jgi:hypothetical protein
MIIFAPFLYSESASLKERFKGIMLGKRTALALSVILLALSSLLFLIPRRYAELYTYIEPSVNYLENKEEGGNVLGPYEYGTYLIHRLYPEYKVFMDGRSYLYDPNLVYVDYRRIAYGDAEDKRFLLSCYPVDYVVWPESAKSLISFLYESPDFEKVFNDGVFAVFKRRPER